MADGSMPAQRRGRSKQEIIDAARSRFWARVDSSDGPNACWPWVGSHVVGYGSFYAGGGRQGVNEYAHRLALYYTTGSFGCVAMHSCDNRGCCNPAHLSWATQQENCLDALRKGRAYLGEANSNAKLTETLVRQVRELRKNGWTYKQIESETGVRRANVAYVCTKGWRGVDG